MKGLNTPATAKEAYLPHDCKQYGFPSAPLKSLDIQNMSVPWAVTKFGDDPENLSWMGDLLPDQLLNPPAFQDLHDII